MIENRKKVFGGLAKRLWVLAKKIAGDTSDDASLMRRMIRQFPSIPFSIPESCKNNYYIVQSLEVLHQGMRVFVILVRRWRPYELFFTTSPFVLERSHGTAELHLSQRKIFLYIKL